VKEDHEVEVVAQQDKEILNPKMEKEDKEKKEEDLQSPSILTNR
jgi:hypothetical protein